MELLNLTPNEALEALTQIEDRLVEYFESEATYIAAELGHDVDGEFDAFTSGYGEALAVIRDMISTNRLEEMGMRGLH